LILSRRRQCHWWRFRCQRRPRLRWCGW
jgi:hypothetical protein